ncbi:MAG: Tetratricopeptide 2 repeat protein, partial [Bryobacterales bacterium]|nr:Tetratricopeptide 2 repeat protein [Bryobacterales bacterium]
MKCCVVLLCAFLTGCTKDASTDQSTVLRTIETARARHDIDGALRLADRSLRRKDSPDEFRARLYILKSQILREREGLESARAFLASVANPGTPAAAYLLKREQAAVDSDLGRFEKADQLLLEAIAISRSAGKPKQVAGTEVVRSRILLKLDRPEEAQRCLDSAKRYGDVSGDHSLDAYILQFAGRIMLESNRFESAIAPLQASYQRFRDENKPQLAAKLWIDLAWAYYRLGRLDKAQQLYEQAERDVGSGDKHICLGHLGNIFYDRGDLEHAAANYKQAAELARNENKDYYSLWLSNLAGTLAEEKQWKPAAQYISESLAIAKSIPGSIGLYHAMVNAGIIAAGQHDYTSAERQLQEVQRTPRANPAAVLEAYAALAKVYADTSRQAAARRQFETALRLVDETRTNLREDEDKLSYLASLMKLHQQYIAFLMARGDVAGAFQASEMSRARVLRDRVNLNGTTRVSHDIADYRKAARASAAAYLVYWVAPEKSFLWVIDGTGFKSLALPGEARIRALVERHQRTLERNASTSGPEQGTAAELFDAVVEPARRVVPKAKRFVIVPDGPLYGINFETLRSGSRYWIEDSTIAVAPSLELLLGKSAPRQR